MRMAGGTVLEERQFRARCPRCGNTTFEAPDRLDLGADFRCRACGHAGKLVEFADLATLDAILEVLKKRTIEAVGEGTVGNATP